MTSLAQYDRARAALAEASQIEDVLPLLDEFELAKVRARQIKDQVLLADATEFQLRAERRLGQILEAAKAAGLFRQGRQKKGKSADSGTISRPTLEEAGIDRHISARAQKRAGIAEQAFEAMVSRTRNRIAAGHAKIIPSDEIHGARALMGSRFEADDSLDYFPTPPWATRALMECVLPHIGVDSIASAWEPASGEGHIAEVLKEYCPSVLASDIANYGYDLQTEHDFLGDDIKLCAPKCDWVITNPPFDDKAAQFVLRALEFARVGVAMFFRLQWIPTKGRYEKIFRDNAPTLVSFFCERVNLCKGRWNPDGSTATDYIWLVWLKGEQPRAPFWIPPGQRQALEHDGDRERFTTHPVTHLVRADELPPHNPETGELLEGDKLDIPKFLRRGDQAEARP